MQVLLFEGRVPVKKNSYRISKNGGFFKPKKITDFEEYVADILRASRAKEVLGKMTLTITFEVVIDDRDLDGMTTTLIDALQDGGLFANDKDIIAFATRKTINENPEGKDRTVVTITSKK